MNLFKTTSIILVFVSLLYSNDTKKDMPAIVPVKWIKENIQNPNLVLVDVRTKEEFNKEHIKNAVNIPALKSLFDEKTWMMPKLDHLKNIFSNAGIDKNSLVVVYDNGEFLWAARFYWILEVLGHNNVGLSKYAYGSYLKSKLGVSKKAKKVVAKEFIPRVDNTQIQTKLSTLLSIGNKTIIDGRAKDHYDGKESIAKRYGHIPTAVNYACTNNFQVSKDGNRIKDFKHLKEVYKNIDKNKDIILYCQGGAEAALNYIVLKELGFSASVYDGSWKEWGNDSNLPVENPLEVGK